MGLSETSAKRYFGLLNLLLFLMQSGRRCSRCQRLRSALAGGPQAAFYSARLMMIFCTSLVPS